MCSFHTSEIRRSTEPSPRNAQAVSNNSQQPTVEQSSAKQRRCQLIARPEKREESARITDSDVVAVSTTVERLCSSFSSTAPKLSSLLPAADQPLFQVVANAQPDSVKACQVLCRRPTYRAQRTTANALSDQYVLFRTVASGGLHSLNLAPNIWPFVRSAVLPWNSFNAY